MPETSYRTPLPWHYKSGAIYAKKPKDTYPHTVVEVCVIQADRNEEGTFGAERDDNVKYALEAANNYERVLAEKKTLSDALESMTRIIFSDYVRADELGDFNDGAKWVRDGKFFAANLDRAQELLLSAGYAQSQIDSILNDVRLEISQDVMDELEDDDEEN